MAVLMTARGQTWLLLAAAIPFVLMLAIRPVRSAPVYEDEHHLEPILDDSGCYYNYQHYGEGDRIITNEPCLNCTCHNRMLMCYLRVCPFTKAIGQDCKVEKKADQCCPVITCPEVPVTLLSHPTPSTTSRPYSDNSSSTHVGHPDNYGCTIDSQFYADGAQVPSDLSKPCELCYCIRNRTACVMQECTLNVEGCKPVYQDGVCCPVRYECDYPEEGTTLEPSYSGGLILTTTTTMSPNLGCRYNDEEYGDGALIKMEHKPCEHCYCMRGDIVCAVQECGKPLEKEGNNCTALPPQPGKCCPEMYQCDTGIEYVMDSAFRMNRKHYGNTYYDSLNEPGSENNQSGQPDAVAHDSVDEKETSSPAESRPDTEADKEQPTEESQPPTKEEEVQSSSEPNTPETVPSEEVTNQHGDGVVSDAVEDTHETDDISHDQSEPAHEQQDETSKPVTEDKKPEQIEPVELTTAAGVTTHVENEIHDSAVTQTIEETVGPDSDVASDDVEQDAEEPISVTTEQQDVGTDETENEVQHDNIDTASQEESEHGDSHETAGAGVALDAGDDEDVQATPVGSTEESVPEITTTAGLNEDGHSNTNEVAHDDSVAGTEHPTHFETSTHAHVPAVTTADVEEQKPIFKPESDDTEQQQLDDLTHTIEDIQQQAVSEPEKLDDSQDKVEAATESSIVHDTKPTESDSVQDDKNEENASVMSVVEQVTSSKEPMESDSLTFQHDNVHEAPDTSDDKVESLTEATSSTSQKDEDAYSKIPEVSTDVPSSTSHEVESGEKPSSDETASVPASDDKLDTPSEPLATSAPVDSEPASADGPVESSTGDSSVQSEPTSADAPEHPVNVEEPAKQPAESDSTNQSEDSSSSGVQDEAHQPPSQSDDTTESSAEHVSTDAPVDSNTEADQANQDSAVPDVPAEADQANEDAKPALSDVPAEADQANEDAKPALSDVPAEADQANEDAKPAFPDVPAEADQANEDAKPALSDVPAEADQANEDAKPALSDVPAEADQANEDAKPAFPDVPAEFNNDPVPTDAPVTSQPESTSSDEAESSDHVGTDAAEEPAATNAPTHSEPLDDGAAEAVLTDQPQEFSDKPEADLPDSQPPHSVSDDSAHQPDAVATDTPAESDDESSSTGEPSISDVTPGSEVVTESSATDKPHEPAHSDAVDETFAEHAPLDKPAESVEDIKPTLPQSDSAVENDSEIGGEPASTEKSKDQETVQTVNPFIADAESGSTEKIDQPNMETSSTEDQDEQSETAHTGEPDVSNVDQTTDKPSETVADHTQTDDAEKPFKESSGAKPVIQQDKPGSLADNEETETNAPETQTDQIHVTDKPEETQQDAAHDSVDNDNAATSGEQDASTTVAIDEASHVDEDKTTDKVQTVSEPVPQHDIAHDDHLYGDDKLPIEIAQTPFENNAETIDKLGESQQNDDDSDSSKQTTVMQEDATEKVTVQDEVHKEVENNYDNQHVTLQHIPQTHPAMQDFEESNPSHFDEHGEEFVPDEIPTVHDTQSVHHDHAPTTESSVGIEHFDEDEKHSDKPVLDSSHESAEEVTEIGDDGFTQSTVEETSVPFLSEEIPDERDCYVDNKKYSNGASIPVANPCQEQCTCEKGIVHCLLKNCPPPPSSSPDCMPMYKDGSCCPLYTCVDDDGQVISHDVESEHDTQMQDVTSEDQGTSSTEEPINNEVPTTVTNTAASQDEIGSEVAEPIPEKDVPQQDVISSGEVASDDEATPTTSSPVNDEVSSDKEPSKPEDANADSTPQIDEQEQVSDEVAQTGAPVDGVSTPASHGEDATSTAAHDDQEPETQSISDTLDDETPGTHPAHGVALDAGEEPDQVPGSLQIKPQVEDVAHDSEASTVGSALNEPSSTDASETSSDTAQNEEAATTATSEDKLSDTSAEHDGITDPTAMEEVHATDKPNTEVVSDEADEVKPNDVEESVDIAHDTPTDSPTPVESEIASTDKTDNEESSSPDTSETPEHTSEFTQDVSQNKPIEAADLHLDEKPESNKEETSTAGESFPDVKPTISSAGSETPESDDAHVQDNEGESETDAHNAQVPSTGDEPESPVAVSDAAVTNPPENAIVDEISTEKIEAPVRDEIKPSYPAVHESEVESSQKEPSGTVGMDEPSHADGEFSTVTSSDISHDESGNEQSEAENTPTESSADDVKDEASTVASTKPDSSVEQEVGNQEHESETPVTTHDEKPVADDEKPGAEDDSPVTEDDRPAVTEDQSQVTDDDKPIEEDKIPVTEHYEPVVEDGKPAAEHDETVSEDEKPVTEHEKPVSEDAVAEDGKPAAEHEKPVAEDGKPVAEHDETISEDEKPVIEEEKPVSQDDVIEQEKPVAEHDEPVTEHAETVTEGDKPVTEEDKPVATEDNTPVAEEAVTEGGKPVAEEAVTEHDAPVAEDGKPAAEHDETVAEDGKPVAEHDESVTEDGKPAAEHDETVAEEEKPVTEHDAPVAAHDVSVSEDKEPVATDKPVAEHDESVTEGDKPVTEEDKPVETEDETPVAGQDESVTEGGKPVAEETVTEHGAPAAEHDESVSEDEKPVAGHEKPAVEDAVTEDGKPVAEHDESVTEGGKPVAEHDESVTEGGKPVAEHDESVTEGGKPVAEHDESVTEHEKPVSQDAVAEDGKPAAEHDETVSEDEKPVTEEDKPVTEDSVTEQDKPIAGQDKPVAELDEPVTEGATPVDDKTPVAEADKPVTVDDTPVSGDDTPVEEGTQAPENEKPAEADKPEHTISEADHGTTDGPEENVEASSVQPAHEAVSAEHDTASKPEHESTEGEHIADGPSEQTQADDVSTDKPETQKEPQEGITNAPESVQHTEVTDAPAETVPETATSSDTASEENTFEITSGDIVSTIDSGSLEHDTKPVSTDKPAQAETSEADSDAHEDAGHEPTTEADKLPAHATPISGGGVALQSEPDEPEVHTSEQDVTESQKPIVDNVNVAGHDESGLNSEVPAQIPLEESYKPEEHYPDPVTQEEDDSEPPFFGSFTGQSEDSETDFMPPMPSYDADDQQNAFGPGTCRYGGKVYVSAQQIPRDDPCDFCFCFRSDIICLQQSCPPPIKGCHEETIEGFCCPRYECPVPMGLLNATTTTTTTTTLPPDLASSYIYGKKRSAGCLVQGRMFEVGQAILSASGPCLDCRCGGDSKMECEPKACSPQPLLRKMMEAVSLRR